MKLLQHYPINDVNEILQRAYAMRQEQAAGVGLRIIQPALKLQKSTSNSSSIFSFPSRSQPSPRPPSEDVSSNDDGSESVATSSALDDKVDDELALMKRDMEKKAKALAGTLGSLLKNVATVTSASSSAAMQTLLSNNGSAVADTTDSTSGGSSASALLVENSQTGRRNRNTNSLGISVTASNTSTASSTKSGGSLSSWGSSFSKNAASWFNAAATSVQAAAAATTSSVGASGSKSAPIASLFHDLKGDVGAPPVVVVEKYNGTALSTVETICLPPPTSATGYDGNNNNKGSSLVYAMRGVGNALKQGGTTLMASSKEGIEQATALIKATALSDDKSSSLSQPSPHEPPSQTETVLFAVDDFDEN